ncbi:colanic acid biosynthesis acetyltransferase WcaF [Poseidonibacter ostreae]|uniref:WcaF family extracellular polysaccharide biosynthesis acetyltransferase n=1 Tax=Poseidonibacter ostreae TaxID=2654171 RepID=UPI001264A52C|nr:WcaF family extracellular polysaccharide biosynthesis acetyltransferase [Poseidonibacter ostreae]KAB7881207.1 colanic acid biosynthesis acetyltransferase WcaF [Poseidonibacter ostreae]
MNKVHLNQFENSWYKPANKLKIFIWYFTNMFLFKTMLPIPSSIKIKVLRTFGASVGNGVVIKPNVNIKYPWFLIIGNDCWIGEDVWIDNLAQVSIGNNVCLSQGAYLLTGSHDYKKEAFDLMLGAIVLENGVWIGAKSVVCPNVTCKSHSVLAVGSVATKSLKEYGIYQGNPAVWKRERIIGE